MQAESGHVWRSILQGTSVLLTEIRVLSIQALSNYYAAEVLRLMTA